MTNKKQSSEIFSQHILSYKHTFTIYFSCSNSFSLFDQLNINIFFYHFLANDFEFGNASPISLKSGSWSSRFFANFRVSDLTASATVMLDDASRITCSTDVAGSTLAAEIASWIVSEMTRSTLPSGFSTAISRRRFDGCVDKYASL